jgi:hypothetical protein
MDLGGTILSNRKNVTRDDSSVGCTIWSVTEQVGSEACASKIVTVESESVSLCQARLRPTSPRPCDIVVTQRFKIWSIEINSNPVVCLWVALGEVNRNHILPLDVTGLVDRNLIYAGSWLARDGTGCRL